MKSRAEAVGKSDDSGAAAGALPGRHMPRERRACATAGLPTGAAWRRGGMMRSASFSICNTLTGLGSTAFRRTLPGVTRRERCGRSAISICPTSTAWSRRAALGETREVGVDESPDSLERGLRKVIRPKPTKPTNKVPKSGRASDRKAADKPGE